MFALLLLAVTKASVVSFYQSTVHYIYRYIVFANSVDPDETAHNEMSHLDFQCLPYCF